MTVFFIVNSSFRQDSLSVGLAFGMSHEKRMLVRDKSSDWYERIVLQTFDDEQWLANFRMSKGTFDLLCEKLKNCLTPSDKTVRSVIDVQKQVAIAFYWLASSAEYRTIGNLFGVGKSTVCICIHKVCNAIVNNLLEQYVNFPEGEELKRVIKGYQESWGFPNCAGAIDGSHISIIAPVDSHGDYINRKGYYSLILQGVCDHKYIFRDINIGWPGRVHDARVFANTEIFHRGENGLLFRTWFKRVQLENKEVNMPVVLLGDPAYPLKPWLLKPFTNRNHLTPIQNAFNYRLSRARMTIENSFGRLKGRWRCLQKRLDVDVEFACTVITTCVVLHNICEISNDRYNEEWNDNEDKDDDMEDSDGAPDLAGNLCAKTLRDDIAVAFANGVI